jgi:hypothetical protein
MNVIVPVVLGGGFVPSLRDSRRILRLPGTDVPGYRLCQSLRDWFVVSPLRLILTGCVMGLRPTQGDEKRLLFSDYCPSKHRPSLCHLDRSAAQWRDLRFSGPFLEMFFDRAPRSQKRDLGHPLKVWTLQLCFRRSKSGRCSFNFDSANGVRRS